MPDRGERDSDGHVDLNPRQRQVLSQVAQGVHDQYIAETLLISPHTVAAHRKRLLERTGLRNRIELVVWASEHEDCCVRKQLDG